MADQYARRRLLKDLQEVLANPLPNVVGRPLEENIFEWHLNVRTDQEEGGESQHHHHRHWHDQSLASAGAFHLKLLFPPTYPCDGPSILLGSPLPHPNVSFDAAITAWKLSLWDCIPGFKGWTSAYSAQSIFLQLQTFLLREDLLYNNRRVDRDTAIQLANDFRCSACPHEGTKPFPPFHSEDAFQVALKQRQRHLVSRPVISRILQSLKKQSEPLHVWDEASRTHAKPSSEPALKSRKVSSEGGCSEPSPKNDKEIDSDQGGRELVVHKRRSKYPQQGLQPGSMLSHESLALQELNLVTEKSSTSSGHTNTNETYLNGKNKDSVIQSTQESSTNPATSNRLIRSAKKNLARTLKWKEARQAIEASMSVAAVAPLLSLPKDAKQPEFTQVGEPKTVTSATDVQQSGSVTRKEATQEAMGVMGKLPLEALTIIVARLATSDLASLSMTCHGLREVCEDGFVWKEILHRQFPATSLEAATMSDWKHAYILESSNIIGSLQCFHSRVTYKEDVLGYPITFTVNPFTQSVDYIEVSFDLLSQTAYYQQHVRTTANNEKFQLLLPLYINEDHFERALPLLRKTGMALCPRPKANGFQPYMVLNFMPKLLNTMVVLICNKGIAVSERATDGFCMIHRLFLALCDKFNLWKEVEKQVLGFIRSEQARSKDQCPSLGDFISMLTVCSSKETSWLKVIRPWISELFDRSILWICKSQPDIAGKFKINPKRGGVDEELLQASWNGHKVGLRLAMFHRGFLQLVARPSDVSLHKVAMAYDALYGMASLPLKKRVQDYWSRTMAVDSWPEFFKFIGLQPPSKEYMTGWLRQSWINSLRKGYHRNSTNFSAIHRHGVSKILLKGETVSLGAFTKV